MSSQQSVWRPYRETPSRPWNIARAKHVFRRAGFGATWSEMQRAREEGPAKSVERMLAGEARTYAMREDFEEMSDIIGMAAVNSDDPNRLKAWWLYRMMFTPDPLGEQLTLMWHNHFATSNLKVRDLSMMHDQNVLFRKHARGKFGVLLHGALDDRALLTWLDADSNRKQHPNENLARELMELFTLGAGNYTEDDIKQAARALSGWTVKRDRVLLRDERHDDGEKSILGNSGKFGVSELVDLLLRQEATSRRIAWRLCDHFMGEGVVDDDAVNELATGLRDHDLDIGWATERLLRSELFFSDQNMATQIRSPVSHLIGTVRSLEQLDRPPSTMILAKWCARLGQDLFYPPNVGGWNGGRDWLTSRTIIARSNFAAALVRGELRSPVSHQGFDRLGKQLEVADAQSFAKLLMSQRPDESTLKQMPKDDTGELIARLLSQPEAMLN